MPGISRVFKLKGVNIFQKHEICENATHIWKSQKFSFVSFLPNWIFSTSCQILWNSNNSVNHSFTVFCPDTGHEIKWDQVKNLTHELAQLSCFMNQPCQISTSAVMSPNVSDIYKGRWERTFGSWWVWWSFPPLTLMIWFVVPEHQAFLSLLHWTAENRSGDNKWGHFLDWTTPTCRNSFHTKEGRQRFFMAWEFR